MRTLSDSAARRLVLRSLGLAGGRPEPGTRRDVRHLRRVVEAVGVVQLDSVNVLARAHELPFWSRLGAHDRSHRDRWLWRSRELYEGRVHEASLVPVALWPLLAHRRAAVRPGRQLTAALREDPGVSERVLAEVAARGPLRSRELTVRGGAPGSWWDHAPEKVALADLAERGEVVVHDRTPSFELCYDLPARVLPEPVHQAEIPDRAEAVRELLLAAARAQGVGTAAHLADHHRLPIREARRALAQLAAQGELREVRVAAFGADPAYLHPEAVIPRRSQAACLVSPFDPLVWHRERTSRLFGFTYRIEIYVPAAARVHGYYVLPFLLGVHLVGRVDLKADRQRRRLLVRGAFAEPEVSLAVVAHELAAELRGLAAWLELEDVEVAAHGGLAAPLARALADA